MRNKQTNKQTKKNENAKKNTINKLREDSYRAINTQMSMGFMFMSDHKCKTIDRWNCAERNECVQMPPKQTISSHSD